MVDDVNSHDLEQNRRIREVEGRINALENQVATLIGKLETMTGMLKVLAIGLGAMLGIDLQGMVM